MCIYIYIYLYSQIITERKEKKIKGINISRNKTVKALYFRGRQSTIQKVHYKFPLKLEIITSKYKLQISTSQKETLVLKEDIQWEVKL